MNLIKIIRIIFPSIILTFFIISSFYVEQDTPLVYSGGCTDSEYEAVIYMNKNLEKDSFIFTDLRLYSILNEKSDFRVIVAPGSASSDLDEINATYYAFYSNNSYKAYWCIRYLIDLYYDPPESYDFYVFFSKSYVYEGIGTYDYIFGPISIESYEKYLNSPYFKIVFKNDQTFIVKAYAD